MEEGAATGTTARGVAKAVRKLMSDKPGYVAGMDVALTRAWCPLSRLEVKEMGGTNFLFLFQQEAWKRKAVENGSWTFGKDLLVMEDFDPAKSIDEYTFEKVPIWVRIFNVPLGMMCKELAENIAEQIGELVEVYTGEDGTALGQYLRMKVRIRVVDPLMRGLYLDEEEDIDGDAIVKERRGKEDEGRKMCYFQYEFLPDFFYTCGRMGHTD
ncbi:hypothetical protein ZWY2020_001100 [Hordeum vulgare]|nr:hypothetical protein ZWY2020_001100 [Hordeum vulgare]